MQNVYTDSGVYGIDIYPEESYGLYGYLYIGQGSFIYYEIRDMLLASCLLTILERMQTRRIQRLRKESSWRKDELIYLCISFLFRK